MTRTTLAVAATLASIAAVAASVAAALDASAAPRPAVQGVCVSYGTLPLVDRDAVYVARIYTPDHVAPRLCDKGDTFVAVAPGHAPNPQNGQ